MFVTDDFVFVELHKTGSEHIRMLLDTYFDGLKIGKHAPARADMFTPNRVFFGSIRNPWEWYLSLWAYGCSGKGELFLNLTERKYTLNNRGWKKRPVAAFRSIYNEVVKDTDEWQYYYSDVNDPKKFKQWLFKLHNPEYALGIGENYFCHECHKFCGLMTYRYLRLYCKGEFSDISKFSDLKEYVKNNRYISHFVRNERLESDLVKILSVIFHDLPESLKKGIHNSGRTNTATSGISSLDYWDRESIQIISEREKLVIEEHDYAPPNRTG